MRPVDPATGAGSAMVFAMYHPAAALRTPAIERESYADIANVPATLIESRRRRERIAPPVPSTPTPSPEATEVVDTIEVIEVIDVLETSETSSEPLGLTLF
jgi:hypothetical protein